MSLAKNHLESVSVDMLGPLLKTKVGNNFLLVVANCFTEMRQDFPMKRKTCIEVSKAFSSHWVFK